MAQKKKRPRSVPQRNPQKTPQTAPQKKKQKKIIRYRRPLNINVGMIIFALIFVYMVFSVYTYIRRDRVQFYEVSEGSIVNRTDYTGVILRQEEVESADRTGYINYYIREGKRASVGSRVYSIDEAGNIASLLAESPGEHAKLNKEDYAELKKQLTTFSLTYDDNHFQTVYDTKYALEADVLEYMNFNALDDLDTLAEGASINFQQVRSDKAGVISYGIDGYEALNASQISEDVFDQSSYKKTITKSGKQIMEAGSPVYKIITSDLWSIIFPMSEDDVKDYGGRKNLTIVLNGRDLKTTGTFSMVTGTDGAPYGKLDLDKYMIQFASDRFIKFEIISDMENGLKIPATAVTTKNFYLVPVEYITQGGDSSETGFNKEVYSESGASVEFVPTTIYYQDEDNYYIEMNEKSGFHSGDYIVKPNASDRFQIGASASLQGVYNINKGFAVFKQIDVISTNDEYYTVKKNTSYGLSVYDHIVLDASTVEEGELIYQ